MKSESENLSTNDFSEPQYHHTFFLNIEHAYMEAEKQNKVVNDSGEEELQYCYYEGPLTDIPLENFIMVEQANFVDFFSNNQLPIPTHIQYQDGNLLDLTVNSPDILDEINNYRKKLKPQYFTHQDSYFFDELDALNTAKQKNRVYCGHPTVDGLQICYIHNKTIQCNLQNFISLDFNQLVDFFIDSNLRIPAKLILPKQLEDELKENIEKGFNEGKASIEKEKNNLFQELVAIAKNIQPDWNDETHRVFLPTNRYTQVMQYSSKGVSSAFQQAGYKTLLYIQSNDMEGFNSIDMLKKHIEFKPHIVFQINHLNNFYLHDDVFNFVWFQDPMPPIKKRERLPWRDNDYIFAYSKLIQDMIKACGKEDFINQSFCIDEGVFYINNPEDERNDKIVFLGSSSYHMIKLFNDIQNSALQQFKNLFIQGISLTEELIEMVCEEHNVNPDKMIYGINHIVRNTSLEWLCLQDEVTFELYGRGWSYNPLFLKYNKGEIEHGKNVADIYRKAKYALVCLPWEVESQRLAEVIACGCIPIVYDSRAYSNYTDTLGLTYYKTQDDLLNLLKKRKTINRNIQLPAKFTYKHLIKKCIKIINDKKFITIS